KSLSAIPVRVCKRIPPDHSRDLPEDGKRCRLTPAFASCPTGPPVATLPTFFLDRGRHGVMITSVGSCERGMTGYVPVVSRVPHRFALGSSRSRLSIV